MEKKKKIYLGLDIGTDSVGYAVTDEGYNLQRFHGADAWGSVCFDAAATSAERRGYRSARRRLDRRQQRVQLLQEIFAEEIYKVDERFFIRLSESYRWRDETEDPHIFFNDEDYSDPQYMRDYPTIHHLILELMTDPNPHDVRLVYLACSWLVAHRGHFLNNMNVERLDQILDFESVYKKFEEFFRDNDYDMPWGEIDLQKFQDVLKKKLKLTPKFAELKEVLLGGAKPEKNGWERFPFSQESLIRLLAGGTCKVKDIFGKEEYEELGSISLGMDEEKFAELMTAIGEDYGVIEACRRIYDWTVLEGVLGENSEAKAISAAKLAVYDRHKEDLCFLKHFVRKYIPEKYGEIFREAGKANYVAYSYHVEKADAGNVKKANVDDFSDYIKKIVKNVVVEAEDEAAYQDMMDRLELRTFLPKQKNTDNRVIPRQLYEYELLKILDQASGYLAFLNETDEEGYTGRDKIHSIFTFKLPYYVGPLNTKSEHAWIVRKAGKITPWNYQDMIDDNASEEAFIARMTNKCSYLPGEDVLPKDSLCYQKFMVLNEINNLKIDGRKIPVEAKQGIYRDLFERKKKVRRKELVDYLISNAYLDKDKLESLSGIDQEIHGSLSTYLAFRNLLREGKLSEKDVERIVERASYAEDKSRVEKWLQKEYPKLPKEDIKYITKIKIHDFGRLSRALLMELEGTEKEVGEATTILRTMWETNDNLMEILSDRYTFTEAIEDFREDYYREHPKTLKEQLDEMYVSNGVRRSIYRTLAVVKDVEKAFGKPDKIFVEMTRGGRADQKGKRTSSRYQQVLDLYKKCGEDVRDLQKELESLGEYVENRLQGDRLFLYFMQFGLCAYSGTPIDLEKLMAGAKEYDIDHIYPQAYVKDDSIINNKVLVLSSINGTKKDRYPIDADIRKTMKGYWDHWHKIGSISDEKYKRLIRSTPFTADEKYGFINRQLTETSQSTKVITNLLKEKYPDAEIVYSKAGLVSDFRHEFDLPKCRSYNDLHHAVDAYLNIVVGNVYNMKFSKKWFKPEDSYSIKTKTIFTHPLDLTKCGGEEVWDGQAMLSKVKKTARKNSAHFVKYATFKTGGLFDQMPVKKGAGLIPLKAGLATERYGGYNKAGVMFLIPTQYKMGKKKEIMIMPVELLYGERFLKDADFAKEYAYDRLKRILKKPVEEVTFPMGMRPWKINTILSFDGFRACITGTGSGGTRIMLQNIMQFSSHPYWNEYIKKLEKFVEKVEKNPKYIYDEVYDKVSKEDNEKLYQLYIEKYERSIYQKRMGSPKKILIEGREKFQALEIYKQCKLLLSIQKTFCRMSGGCDLEGIGGAKTTALTYIGTKISNWKKEYSDVRIIDPSPSGLWERKSENLLELL